jgi:hypothetical protein
MTPGGDPRKVSQTIWWVDTVEQKTRLPGTIGLGISGVGRDSGAGKGRAVGPGESPSSLGCGAFAEQEHSTNDQQHPHGVKPLEDLSQEDDRQQ